MPPGQSAAEHGTTTEVAVVVVVQHFLWSTRNCILIFLTLPTACRVADAGLTQGTIRKKLSVIVQQNCCVLFCLRYFHA
jgi:hypothetical protein